MAEVVMLFAAAAAGECLISKCLEEGLQVYKKSRNSVVIDGCGAYCLGTKPVMPRELFMSPVMDQLREEKRISKSGIMVVKGPQECGKSVCAAVLFGRIKQSRPVNLAYFSGMKLSAIRHSFQFAEGVAGWMDACRQKSNHQPIIIIDDAPVTDDNLDEWVGLAKDAADNMGLIYLFKDDTKAVDDLIDRNNRIRLGVEVGSLQFTKEMCYKVVCNRYKAKLDEPTFYDTYDELAERFRTPTGVINNTDLSADGKLKIRDLDPFERPRNRVTRYWCRNEPETAGCQTRRSTVCM